MVSVTDPEICRLVDAGRSVDVFEGADGALWCWHPTTAIMSATTKAVASLILVIYLAELVARSGWVNVI